jgi:hypothetical protein
MSDTGYGHPKMVTDANTDSRDLCGLERLPANTLLPVQLGNGRCQNVALFGGSRTPAARAEPQADIELLKKLARNTLM